jgi:hypothetical protein
LKQAHHGTTRLGKEGVVIAGDEKRSAHDGLP